MPNISVNSGRCVGAGQCMMAAPDYFDLGETNLVEVLRSAVPAVDVNQVQEAVALCPAQVITLSIE